jgi:hypothetical protein
MCARSQNREECNNEYKVVGDSNIEFIKWS